MKTYFLILLYILTNLIYFSSFECNTHSFDLKNKNQHEDFLDGQKVLLSKRRIGKLF
jgi:hypothetical protein